MGIIVKDCYITMRKAPSTFTSLISLLSLCSIIWNTAAFTIDTSKEGILKSTSSSRSATTFVHLNSLQPKIANTFIIAHKAKEEETDDAPFFATEAKLTLEEKMAKWEEDGQGGSEIAKEKEKMGGFDIGLILAFPLIVGTSLLFVVFPFIKDSIDVTSVGPPPTV